jgi:hypothetical protein
MKNRQQGSTYVQVKQAIEQEHESATRGLLGSAVVSRHAFIETRLSRGTERILQLIEQQQFTAAIHLMEKPLWGEEEEGGERYPS